MAIVGYTNAGKSTLLNRLTDAGVLVEDRLFATLDATTRRLDLPGGEKVLLTDTVGFIRKLPHQLVEAFKSTLSVASDADLLVHVVDASALDPEGNIDAVRTVLREIDADEVPVLYAFNKSDLAPSEAARLAKVHEGAVAFSATTGEGVEELLLTIAARLRALTTVVELAVPYDRGDVLAAVHREGEVLSEQAGDDAHGAAGAARRRLARPVHRLRGGVSVAAEPFVPPPYPYDRLDELKAVGEALPGGLVDLSIGTPCDPPPPAVVEALARSGAERGYPPSIGTAAYREAAAGWMARRLGVEVDPAARGGVRRHQGARGRHPAVAAAAAPRSRHGAVPGDQLPHLRDGRHPRRLPGGALPRRSTTSIRPTPPAPCASG